VWADKVGLGSDDIEVTDGMEFGTLAELGLTTWMQRKTGLWTVGAQQRVTSPVRPWMLATVDGYAVETPDATPDDAVAGVEIKTTTDSADEWATQIPLHYQAQAQWQMACTGLPATVMPTLHLAFGRLQFEVHQVARDEDDIAMLIDAGHRFWLGPAWTDRTVDDSVEADPDLIAVVDNLRAAKATAKALDEEITYYENQIKAALAEHTTLCAGHDPKGRPISLATWKPQPRNTVDVTALRARYPRAIARHTTTTTSRVLRLGKPPKGE
jgi:predicted phage-related endonuclease